MDHNQIYFKIEFTNNEGFTLDHGGIRSSFHQNDRQEDQKIPSLPERMMPPYSVH